MMNRLALVLALSVAVPASAVPLTLAHQGRLLDGTGTPLSGTQNLVVTLSDSTGPTWTGQYMSQPVDNGYYALVLGSDGSLDAEDLAGDGVTVTVGLVGGVTLGTQPLTSVPFAVHASNATNVSGGVQVTGAAVCAGAADAGTLRWTGTALQVCSGSANDWTSVGTERVAFLARQLVSQTQAQVPVLFATEDFDDGGGYDLATGVFAAPVAGTYSFSYHLVFGNGSTSGNYVWAYLQSNVDPTGGGSWVSASGVAPSYNEYSNQGINNSYRVCASTVLVELSQGEAVRVSTGAHSSVNAPLYSPSSYWSGFLLHED